VIPQLFSARITWEDVAWLRRLWPRKLIIKGVLSVTDARRAADYGCDAIVLTNHGGRQMDHCVAGMDVLPEIAAALAGRLTLIVDGGIRRGVRRALEILTSEIDRALGHLGCNSMSELSPALLRRRAG
jgi:(S)-mandelate dehydrogenase